jgi:hypothetical protein
MVTSLWWLTSLEGRLRGLRRGVVREADATNVKCTTLANVRAYAACQFVRRQHGRLAICSEKRAASDARCQDGDTTSVGRANDPGPTRS